MPAALHDTTRRLANYMKSRLATGQPPYAIFLGAGASVPSAYPTASTFVDRFLEYSAMDASGMSDSERRAAFDSKWQLAGEANTRAFLSETLPWTIPSTGYTMLAALARAKYLSNIVTTNVDTLLQQALTSGQAHPQGYSLVSHPLFPARQIADELGAAEPRIKVLKLHGDLPSGRFLFTEQELETFPGELARSLTSILQRDVIFCGYGFNDADVRKCLKRPRGTPAPSVIVAAPEAPSTETISLLTKHAAGLQIIAGEAGDFDEFMKQLATELGLYAPGAWTTFDTQFEHHSLEGVSVIRGSAWTQAQDLMVGSQTEPAVLQFANLFFGENEAQIDIRGEFQGMRSLEDWIGVSSTSQMWSHLVYVRTTGSLEILAPPFGSPISVADSAIDIAGTFHLRVTVGMQKLTAALLGPDGEIMSEVDRTHGEEQRWRGGLFLQTYHTKVRLSSISVRPYPAN